MEGGGGGVGEVAEVDDGGAAEALFVEEGEDFGEGELTLTELDGAEGGAGADGVGGGELGDAAGEIGGGVERAFAGGDEAGAFEIDAGVVVVDLLENVGQRSGGVGGEGQGERGAGGVDGLGELAECGDKRGLRDGGGGEVAEVEGEGVDAEIAGEVDGFAGGVHGAVDGGGIGEAAAGRGDAEGREVEMFGVEDFADMAASGEVELVGAEFGVVGGDGDAGVTGGGGEVE